MTSLNFYFFKVDFAFANNKTHLFNRAPHPSNLPFRFFFFAFESL